MKKYMMLFSVLLSVLLLSSCGSTSSDGVTARPIEKAALKGTVTDAVITNGVLRVYALDNGVKGELLGETVTDSKGDFNIQDFASKDRPIMIEVSGGRYTEEASGVNVELIPGQTLRAYLFYKQGSELDIQVTPLTHLSSCLADYKVKSGVNINNAITEATSVFSGLIGVDILGTRPLNITDPANANFELTDSLRYGTVLAAISSYTADISEINGVTPHRFNQNTSIYATQVLCQDIASDGVFNGQGYINNTNSIGQLALGSVQIDVDFLRTRTAQGILNIMSSDRNETSLPVSDFVLYANGIAGSTDGVFGGVATTPVDQEGPTVTAVLAPDSYLKGLADLDFNVTDPIGVKSVQFLVNDVPHSAGQVISPKMSINTTGYTDGIIKISVVATDILNNETIMDFNYVVDNSSPTVALTSAQLVNNKAYAATGTYQEEGAPVTSITVNGVDAAIDTVNGTWSADVELLSGQNMVTVAVVDSVGNTNSVDVPVNVDLILPRITPNSTLTTFTTFQGQLNLCTSGQITPSSANGNPVCLSTDNVSLNGVALDGGLQNFGYVLLGFSPSDPQGAGVFTDQNELTVEYKYDLNGVEKVAWTVAPKVVNLATQDANYFFPMVTEYLGANWYQTTTTDVHTVTFRVTDKAGNFKELAYELQFDVLVPEVTINTVIDDSLLLATNFSNRTAIDGAGINVNYTFSNTSRSPLLISLDDAANHEVVHTYETGVRENQVRLVTTEESQFNFGSGWIITSAVYDGNFNKITANNTTKDSYVTKFSDTPSSPDLSAWAAVDPSVICSLPYRSYNSYGTNYIYERRYSLFDRPGILLKTIYGKYITYQLPSNSAGYVSAKNSVSNCALAYKNINWQKRKKYSYENKSGYPRNNIKSVVTNYNVATESITVTNETLGQVILPINGWYAVPANTDISIKKTIRQPVLAHYYDDLSNVTYTLKKEDKTTTWNIDTDLTINRVINPGDISNVNNVTPSVTVAGNGIYTKTVSR